VIQQETRDTVVSTVHILQRNEQFSDLKISGFEWEKELLVAIQADPASFH